MKPPKDELKPIAIAWINLDPSSGYIKKFKKIIKMETAIVIIIGAIINIKTFKN